MLCGWGRPRLRTTVESMSPMLRVGRLRGLGCRQLLGRGLVGHAVIHAGDRGLPEEVALRTGAVSGLLSGSVHNHIAQPSAPLGPSHANHPFTPRRLKLRHRAAFPRTQLLSGHTLLHPMVMS